jgi:hypothetical protein
MEVRVKLHSLSTLPPVKSPQYPMRRLRLGILKKI